MAYRNPQITALHDRLEPFDTLNPPDAFWIEGSEDGDATGGYDFCEECGEGAVERLSLYAPGSQTFELMCCDPCGENDSTPYCRDCGKTLAGWPTDYCRDEELVRLEESELSLPDPETVHIVNMALWNLQWSENDEMVAAWQAVAERLLATMPETATT